jgi:hypothetical protein
MMVDNAAVTVFLVQQCKGAPVPNRNNYTIGAIAYIIHILNTNRVSAEA